MSTAAALPDAELRRGARAWMLFDWANQPFYTLVITFIFAPYFAASVAEDPAAGQALWADVTTVAGLCVAALAPLLGAIADQSGPRKPWIGAFSVLFVAGCLGLWTASPGVDPIWPVLAFFVIAFVGSEFSLIFTNAMLPDLGPRERLGRISGSGWALGYAGGVVTLILVLVLISPAPGRETTLIGIPPILGLDASEGEPARATGPLTALWFALFAIPLFLYTPDAPRRAGIGGAARRGLRQLVGTLSALPRNQPILRYLIASMIYRDALAGLFIFGGIYAAGVLGWQTFQLGVFGIVAALTGALGSWLGGRADSAFGPRPVIATAIVVLIVVSATALATSRDAVWFVAIPPGSGLPDLVFYVCGGLLGAGAGALQAASRTMMVHLADGRIAMTEAFGLYALSGKATAFLAPLAIGLATDATGSQALGVSPVIVLFALGLVLLYSVKTDNEARA